MKFPSVRCTEKFLNRSRSHRCLRRRHVSDKSTLSKKGKRRKEGKRRTKFRVANRLRGTKNPLVWCIKCRKRRNSNVGSNVPRPGRGQSLSLRRYGLVVRRGTFSNGVFTKAVTPANHRRRRSVLILDRWTRFTRW